MVLLLCPQKADAATEIFVRKGVTGNITFNSAPVPNAAWKVKKKSILKLKSSTPVKAVYTGMKVGKTTLTCYNRRVPSQKMDITVYVMPSGKLNSMDFKFYGSIVPKYFNKPEGTNWSKSFPGEGSRLHYINVPYNSNVTASNTGNYFQTFRTASLLDSYSRIKMLYGPGSLKKFKKSDKYYKYHCRRASDTEQFFSKYVKYYTDYKYGKKFRIRFYFNSSKKVTNICFIQNYNKL